MFDVCLEWGFSGATPMWTARYVGNLLPKNVSFLQQPYVVGGRVGDTTRLRTQTALEINKTFGCCGWKVAACGKDADADAFFLWIDLSKLTNFETRGFDRVSTSEPECVLLMLAW